jgi:hypothetical protein
MIAILNAILQAGMGCAAVLVYILPLRRRAGWKRWLPVLFLGMLVCEVLLLLEQDFTWGLTWRMVRFLVMVLGMNRCTELSLSADIYCAVWSYLSLQMNGGVSRTVDRMLSAVVRSPALELLVYAATAAGVYLLLACTLARWMPEGGIYQVGPRQLTSALIIGTMYTMLCWLNEEAHHLMGVKMQIIVALCQLYCISLLYLQTELFKKSRLQKDKDVLSYLYDRERQQFDASRQSIQRLNRKYRELEEEIDILQQYIPADRLDAIRPQLDRALQACDTGTISGNSALDIVLTERRLLAEEQHIQLTCVANGELLAFMDVVDIYTLFSQALDNAIEAVCRCQEERQRLIDVLVHEEQRFVVINITNSLAEPLSVYGGLPASTKARSGYGLQILRRVVEKYRGMFRVQTTEESFALKVLIPMPRQETNKI